VEPMTGNFVISEICRSKKCRKTSAVWGTSWYHWMYVYNAITEVSHKPMSLYPSSALWGIVRSRTGNCFV